VAYLAPPDLRITYRSNEKKSLGIAMHHNPSNYGSYIFHPIPMVIVSQGH
jgi:hypothetical protein